MHCFCLREHSFDFLLVILFQSISKAIHCCQIIADTVCVQWNISQRSDPYTFCQINVPVLQISYYLLVCADPFEKD